MKENEYIIKLRVSVKIVVNPKEIQIQATNIIKKNELVEKWNKERALPPYPNG